ncbi:DUF3320 domain-containing protein [Xanthobacter autotrophicus DSM 431]|uniref:DUF3320 domain-containing protein n=1 Tax=Xanthobacter nonsaccharivorans TaxID=3119912 RepID=UPI00372B8055
MAGSFTYASFQNAIPVLRSLRLTNAGERTLTACRLDVSAVPPFLRPKSWTIDRLLAGDEVAITDRRVELDPAYLKDLDEAERGEITFVLSQGQERLAEARIPVRLLARDEWGGVADMPQLLAAFVMPNDPAVAKLLRAASDKLLKHGLPPGMDGYQSEDPKRAGLLAAALYGAVSAQDIHYAEPPASFESRGQKVRRPSTIAATGLATCLDSTLLFAAAFEAAGLHPVLLLFEGHAAAGVWLRKRTLPEAVVGDVMEVRKALAAGELMVFETTAVTRRPVLRVEQAHGALLPRLEEGREHAFRAAIDVRRLREAGIAPLAAHEALAATSVGEAPAGDGLDLPLPPLGREDAVEPAPMEPKPTTPEGRIERWQKKLLDLTLRNRLLNFKDSKKTVPFLCTDLAYLEDRLAGGAGIRVVSLPGQNPLAERDAELYRDMRGQDVRRAYAAEALARDELPSLLTPKQLEARLVDLYREVKNDFAEGGTNTLFLAVGFLRWRRPGEAKDYRAPLLLVPVKLERTAASARFTLRFHEDEPRFNATLLKFLEQEFELPLPQLAGPLPEDDTGIDVPRLLAEVRRAVRDVPGMEVVDETALSTFSFAKYLMWKDLVERTDLLRQNRVVRHLIDTPDVPFPAADRPAPEERDLDRAYAPTDIVSLLPADSSQIVASVMAAEGHDMVIVGPPGTGKSQTIANMIAHCLAVGKTVLFVAEKSAALDVVYRRLREHGLGAHCLELHSSKADRKSFLAQLKVSWEHGARADDSAWTEASARLGAKRDELNAYVEALHRLHGNGLSAYAALGTVLKGEGRAAPAVSWPAADAHDAATLRAMEDFAAEVGRTFAAVGQRPALRFVDADAWSNVWQQGLLAAAADLRRAAEELSDAFARLLGSLGLAARPEARLPDVAGFARFAAAVDTCAGADHAIAFDAEIDRLPQQVEALGAAVSAVRAVEAALHGQFVRAEVGGIPVAELEQEWRLASAAFWPLSATRQARVRKLLATYARTGAKPDPQEALPLLRRWQLLLAEIAASPLAGKPLGFAGPDSDTAAMAMLIANARELRAAFFALGLAEGEAEAVADAMGPIVTGGQDPYGVRGAGVALREALAAFTASAIAFSGAAGCSTRALVGDDTLAGIARAMAELREARTALADWTSWRGVRKTAVARGLGTLVEAVEAGHVPPDGAAAAFSLAYARWWLPLAIDGDPVLRDFRRFRHEHAIDAFRQLDDLVRAHAADRVRLRIAHGLPPVQSVPRSSELGLLRHQMELQRPSKSIREMIGAMPGTFGKLAPCMLMSPLSIAQYLPAGHAQFDVVIFDEASQITTWDAVGAIARGRQTVIVGDPKQLPPTNFFGRNEDEEEIEDHQKDLESILDEARASGLPLRYLRWHYRSRNESLIAFSNQHYYGNRLITFPAPRVEDRAVTLCRVPEGVYDRGKSRTNLAEARALVDEAVKRMRGSLALPERARQTLGVITFNIQQQELIQDLFDAARQDAPEIEWFFSDDRFEPTIVKNLENVQGDERDVIFFSITFAKDAAGVRRMDFGALNRDGGERRLNVAVTRARQELVVFSGTGAEDIDLGRTKALGAQHLKAFLDYAARGAVALAGQDRGSEGGYESPFEEAVAEALMARGWQMVPQVGVSGFRVDLGVRHPDTAGSFLAGIECDGAAYHSSATARDRDKVREEVLRTLGWEILRVWSTDWWLDREGALSRLDDALNALLARSRQPEEVSPAPFPDDTFPTPELDTEETPSAGVASRAGCDAPEETEQVEPVFAGVPFRDAGAALAPADMASPPPTTGAAHDGLFYRVTDLSSFTPQPDAFFEESYAPRLAAMVEAVLACEGPVREDVLAQRIARAHGWLRTGARIRAQIAPHLASQERTRESSGDFLWQAGTVRRILTYRAPSGGATRRGIDEIPLAELASVVANNAAVLAEKDSLLALARRIGFDRLGAATRVRLQEAIDRALQ